MSFTFRHALALGFASVMLLLNAACSSMYNTASAATPVHIEDRLALRMKEGEEQAQRAVRAIADLRRAKPEGRQAAAELLELQGWEVQRRAMSIGDILSRMPQPPAPAAAAMDVLDAAGRRTVAAAQAAARSEAESDLNAASGELSNAIASLRGFHSPHASKGSN